VTVLASIWKNKYDEAQGGIDTRIRPVEWDHELTEEEMYSTEHLDHSVDTNGSTKLSDIDEKKS